MLYLTSGYVGDAQRPVYDIKPGPYNPSPFVYDGQYYTLFDFGFLTCHDALTGKEVYGKQRFPVGSSFTASPWACNGKLFFLSEDGTTFVLRAGSEFERLHSNALEELCLSTSAVRQGHLLIRPASTLYCIADNTWGLGVEK